MKTVNAMQLKAIVKNRAKAIGVSPQLMLQNYMLERLLERISLSRWRGSVVIKGGMLISSLIGVENRSTKDLDTTIRGFSLTHENAESAFREIISIYVDDDVAFEFVRTEDIREGDIYPGVRVFLKANYAPMSVPISVDVTTGDKITPDAIEYSYPLLFDNRSISLMAYPVETILAEKIETVLSRDVANTRPRDYYDIVMLWRLWRQDIDLNTLRNALSATFEKRGSMSALHGYRETMLHVASDDGMLSQWRAYGRRYGYASDMTLSEGCDTVTEILDSIGQEHACVAASSW